MFTSIRFTATSVNLGGTRVLAATALDQGGNPLATQPSLTWSSDNESVLTVNATSGAAHGVALGTANVTVSSGAITATAVVTVATIPSLMITELYGNPVGTDTQGEWIEIFNAGATPVDLTGYALKSNGGSPEDHVFGSFVIAPGSCVVIGTNGSLSTNGGVAMAYVYGGDIILNNGNNDWFTIKTPDGALVDSVAYAIRADGVNPSSFSPFSDDGASYELSFLALDNTTVEGGRWTQSTNVFNASVRGTPGTCPPAEQILTSVNVTATSVNHGATKQLVATARDQNGNAMLTQPAFSWTSNNPSILSVDPATGVGTGVALGSTTVSATTGTLSGSAVINVVDPNAIGSISINSGSVFNLPAGYVAPHFFTARRADNSVISPAPAITWETSDPSVAIIDNLGYLTSLRPGPVTITARAANGVVSNNLNYNISETSIPHTAVYRDHLAFGTPTDGVGAEDLILRKPQYAISYNANRGGPNWVSWQLNASHFGAAPRCDCFSPDVSLPSGVYRVVDLDYRNSGFTRGHMVMSEERTATLQENATSFLLTNILPQAAANNSGPWLNLENHLNDVARDTGKEIYVIAGGIYAPNAPTLKDEGRVAIPHSMWKVALILNSGTGLADVDDLTDVQAIAVIMPNVAADGKSPATGLAGNWETYETTIDAVEAATGYNVLDLLADAIEIPLEAKDKPPVARLTAPATANEGAAVSFDASASSDPDAGDALTYSWSFGDGSAPVVIGPQATHTYANNGTYTVTLTVFDRVAAFHRTTHTIVVNNVAPTVGPFSGATLLPGETYTASGSFTDPGADSWTASVNYGDGSSAQPLSLSAKAFNLSHRYASPGTFTVTVTVADGAGSGSGSQMVTVLSAHQAIQQLVASVQALSGVPNGRSLLSKLEAAFASLTHGNKNAARGQLNAFLNELDAMVQSGRLSPAAAHPLKALVTRVLASIAI